MNLFKHYILDGHKIKNEPDSLAWAKWFETADRHVAINYFGILNTEGKSAFRVSTVFLGIDHSWSAPLLPKNKPVLFETMVFGGKLNGEMKRYCTWDEAEAGHKKMVLRVKRLLVKEI